MKKIIILAVFISAYSFAAVESPFNFLRYISDARAAGMAGAFVSVEDDVASVFYNPAANYTVSDKKLSATFLKHVLDINSGNISYSFDIQNYGKFTGYAGFTNYGQFDYADNAGNLGGTFSASDFMGGLSYSGELDSNFYFGAGVKFIYANLENVSASAVAVDAGLFYRMPERRLNLGLSILHAGTQITKIDGASDKIPLDIRMGFSHELKGLPVLVSFNFHHLGDSDFDTFAERFKSFSAGAEISIGKYIKGRFGYNNLIRSTTASEIDKGLTGLAGGVGIITRTLNFNYGVSMYGSSTSLHRFSVNFDL
jgi:hypothetical protein